MNTKRIVTGGLLAGVSLIAGDFVLNHVLLKAEWHQLYASGYLQTVKPYTVPSAMALDLMLGFILMWLYAFARPRLGPGPKTAIAMATLAWLLFFVPRAFDQWMWYQVPVKIPLVYLFGGLLDCWIAAYLAGWQYIERAP